MQTIQNYATKKIEVSVCPFPLPGLLQRPPELLRPDPGPGVLLLGLPVLDQVPGEREKEGGFFNELLGWPDWLFQSPFLRICCLQGPSVRLHKVVLGS